MLCCRIRIGCNWCLKDVLFFRPASVPGSVCRALWEGCCCRASSTGAAPSQPPSVPFTVSQHRLFNEHLVSASSNPALAMRRKKHTEKEVHADLVSIVSVRLREGYSIREVNITKGDCAALGAGSSDRTVLNCLEESAGSAISAESLVCGGRSHFLQILSLCSGTIAQRRTIQYWLCSCALAMLILCGCKCLERDRQTVTLCILEMSPHNCRETTDRTWGFAEFSGISFILLLFSFLSSPLLDALQNTNTKLSPLLQRI